MKKLIAAILLIALFLSACSIASVPTEPPTEPPTEAPTDPPTDPPTEPPTDPPTTKDLAFARYHAILAADLAHTAARVDAPEIIQYPELPSGCESVALTIAINTYGYDLSKTTVASDYLIYGDDWVTSYVGNPFEYYGAGIYPPGLVKTAARYIKATGAALYPIDTSDATLDQLYRLIDNGIPVIVWATVYMTYPQLANCVTYQGRDYYWYDNEHCLCLIGYDKDAGTVTLSDPQRGIVTESASEFETIYDAVGRFSMILLDTSDF
jgi:uncharacterized protein YvpB